MSTSGTDEHRAHADRGPPGPPHESERTWRSAVREKPALEPQHVLHAIKPGLLALQPERRAHRAGGVGFAAEGAMAKLEPLAGRREHHGVHADLLAATQGG